MLLIDPVVSLLVVLPVVPALVVVPPLVVLLLVDALLELTATVVTDVAPVVLAALPVVRVVADPVVTVMVVEPVVDAASGFNGSV